MDSKSRPSDDDQSPAQSPRKKLARRIKSSELFADAQEVQIEHAGEMYRLRMTRAGKLIMTK